MHTCIWSTPSFLLELSFSIEQSCNQGSMHLHSSHRTELLTAEAGDATLTIDHRKGIFYLNDVRRAYLCTFFTSDTRFFVGARFCAQRIFDKHGCKFTGAFKLQTAADVDRIKVRDAKCFPVSVDRKHFDIGWDPSLLCRNVKRWNIVYPQSDQLCA